MCFANRISTRLRFTRFFSFFFSSFRCWQRFYYFFAQDKQLSHLKGATLHSSQRCSSRPFPPSLINSTENKKIWFFPTKKHVVCPDKSVWKRCTLSRPGTRWKVLSRGVESSRLHPLRSWEPLEDSFVKGNRATTKLILDADSAVWSWKIL